MLSKGMPTNVAATPDTQPLSTSRHRVSMATAVMADPPLASTFDATQA